MTILRYTTFETDEGNILKDIIVPAIMDNEKIHTISPMITSRGAFYRNVSLIEDNIGNTYKVVGNYKDLDKYRKGINRNKIGFI